MIRQTTTRARLATSAARGAAFLAAAVLLAGCFSIPERAWRNGEAMTNSRAYQRIQAGDMSFSTRRQLQTVLNFGSLGFYQETPMYSPFPKAGSWY